jgi:hypothetical protein
LVRTVADARTLARQAIHVGENVAEEHRANTRIIGHLRSLLARLPSLGRGATLEQRRVFLEAMQKIAGDTGYATRIVAQHMSGYLVPERRLALALIKQHNRLHQVNTFDWLARRKTLSPGESQQRQAAFEEAQKLEEVIRRNRGVLGLLGTGARETFVEQAAESRGMISKIDALENERRTVLKKKLEARVGAKKAQTVAVRVRAQKSGYWKRIRERRLKELHALRRAVARVHKTPVLPKSVSQRRERHRERARVLEKQAQKLWFVERRHGAMELLERGNWPAAYKALAPKTLLDALYARQTVLEGQRTRYRRIEAAARGRLEAEETALENALSELNRQRAYVSGAGERALSEAEKKILSGILRRHAQELRIVAEARETRGLMRVAHENVGKPAPVLAEMLANAITSLLAARRGSE